jgi:L-rhamnose mutarotase
MPRHCLTLGLRPDPTLIAEYIEAHRNVPEAIRQSLRDSGILAMQIYEHDAQLFMLLDTTEDFSFERKAAMDRNNPAVLAWEHRMARFQDVSAAADPVSRWQPARCVFELT